MKNQVLFLLVCSAFVARAQGFGDDFPPPDTAPGPLIAPLPSPAAPISPLTPEPKGVQWRPLLLQSLAFISVEHAYRYATEAGTRDPGRPLFHGYLDSVGALHGWADGDPFYVNYVGHPMQGAVSGFLWIQNDRAYRGVEFRRWWNAEYWKSRLRAGAFAWAYSEQMEIGPISEASIGNIQASFPQQGFVDHVVTPVIGLGWLVTEDAMDRYVIRLIERKTQNPFLIAVARGGLNPSRSFANVLSGQWPWARPRGIPGGPIEAPPHRPARETEPPSGVAPFEVAPNAYVLKPRRRVLASAWRCIGGFSNCIRMAGRS